MNAECNPIDGACSCKANVDGLTCDTCANGYHSFPECEGRVFRFKMRGSSLHVCFLLQIASVLLLELMRTTFAAQMASATANPTLKETNVTVVPQVITIQLMGGVKVSHFFTISWSFASQMMCVLNLQMHTEHDRYIIFQTVPVANRAHQTPPVIGTLELVSAKSITRGKTVICARQDTLISPHAGVC